MKQLYDPIQDARFKDPYIDLDEIRQRSTPSGVTLNYRFIHGGFSGTNVKFGFSFPEKENYQGRFFQHLSPFPGPDEEIASQGKQGEDDRVAFAITHGGCFVESNMGSSAIFGSENDSTIFYRSSAAVALYCRVVAKRLFGEHRVYGYVFGGSGGGYKTMSCIENTSAWDGAVPYVIGSPMSLPSCLTVATNGKRLLRNAWPHILDAIEVGGSGDPYKDLNDEEKAALRELTLMGFPLRMLCAFASNDDGSLPVLTPVIHAMDPTYFNDFWTKPGYLGADTESSACRDRVHMVTQVVSVGISQKQSTPTETDDRNDTDTAWQKMMTDGGADYIELTDMPKGNDLYLSGVDMVIKTGSAAGKKLRLGSFEGNKALLGMCYGMDDLNEALASIRPGDEILLDNSDYIALQTFHRHQVPDDKSFHAWDQYKDESGQPIYPQRPKVISFDFTRGGCGSVQDGHIQAKTIVMNSLMDGAFPWQADWYRDKVHEVNGDKSDDMFRVWFNDNCPHGDQTETGDNLRFTSYLGMLSQALLDVSRWVEEGIAPAPNSGYQLVDNQIILADNAKERQAIQPVVHLTIDGRKRICVHPGDTVSLQGQVQTTNASGQLVELGWSFEGEQTYKVIDSPLCIVTEDEITTATTVVSHTYHKPGVYFATLHAISSRDPEDEYIKLRNLDRVRVIVKA